jgi:hypothetical protein
MLTPDQRSRSFANGSGPRSGTLKVVNCIPLCSVFDHKTLSARNVSVSSPRITIFKVETVSAARALDPSSHVGTDPHGWILVIEEAYGLTGDPTALARRTRAQRGGASVFDALVSGTVAGRTILQNDGIVVLITRKVGRAAPRVLGERETLPDRRLPLVCVHFFRLNNKCMVSIKHPKL